MMDDANAYAGSGGAGDGPSDISATLDMTNKLRCFIDLADNVRILAAPGNDSAKIAAVQKLDEVLSSSRFMATDPFQKKLAEYAEDVKSALQPAIVGFKRFTEYAKRVTQDKATELNEGHLKTLATHVDRLRRDGDSIRAYWVTEEFSQYSSRYSGRSYEDEKKRAKLKEVIAAEISRWTKLNDDLTTLKSATSVNDARKKAVASVGDNSVDPELTRKINLAIATCGNATKKDSRHIDVNVDDFKAEIEEIAVSIEKLVEDAKQKLASEAKGFDPRRVSFDDFVNHSLNDPAKLRDRERSTESPLMDVDNAKVFRKQLTPAYVNENIVAALMRSVSSMRELAAKWLRDNKAPPSSSSTTSQPLAAVRQAVEALDRSLAAAEQKLAYPAGATSWRELDDLIQKLADRNLDGMNSKVKLKVATAPSPSGTSSWASEPAKAGAAGPMGGAVGAAGFLYRSIDQMRVFRYLEQAQRFDDEAQDSQLGVFVTTQAGRLTSTLQDLTRQADEIKKGARDDAGGDPDGPTTPGEVALRLRQLGAAKVAAIKSFVRGIRGSAQTHASLHMRFVAERHGEGLRYMRYWEDILKDGGGGDAAAIKDAFGVDDDTSRAITEHNKVVKKLAVDAVAMFVDTVRAEVIKAQRGALTSSDEPRLEDAQLADANASMNRLAEWLVERAENVEETYLSGTPSLTESLTESRTLMLYGLKALRLAIASASLGVAAGTFQGMYERNVYTLDGPPPSPAILVAMALGLDAALHVIVLLVLYTAMRVFKAPDNDFPIDAALLWTWSHDYVAVTVAVGVLSLIVGEVVRSKKYFRFKYEGERGIRAMRELMWYVYCVMLPIPFYRLTAG